jgi:hypothetical protein
MTILLLALLSGAAWAAPRIVCRQPIYLFRAEGNTPMVENTFLIENVGDEPLEITHIYACCRTGVDMLRLIPPGSNSTLHVKLGLEERWGTFVKNVTLESNDPQTPYLTLCMTGTVFRYVDIDPRMIDFGRVAGDLPLQTNATIVFESKFRLNVTNIVSSSPAFTAYFTPNDENYATLTIRTLAPLDEGVYNGEIWLYTDNSVFPLLRVYTAVSVLREYVTVPATLLVSPSATAVSKTVLIRPRHHRPVRVVSVRSTNPAISATCTPTGELGFRCDVRFTDVTANMDNAQIIVTTDDALQRDIVIPVRVGAETTLP